MVAGRRCTSSHRAAARSIALHGQEDTARVIVEAGNIIIADKALRAIVSPYAEWLWHIDLGVADVVSRTGRAEIALMQGIDLLLRRIAAPLHPALQDADRLVVKGQRLSGRPDRTRRMLHAAS